MFVLPVIFFIFAVQADAEKGETIAAPNVIPPATVAMLSPDFWISRIKGNPDHVIMTPDQIRELNEKNRR